MGYTLASQTCFTCKVEVVIEINYMYCNIHRTFRLRYIPYSQSPLSYLVWPGEIVEWNTQGLLMVAKSCTCKRVFLALRHFHDVVQLPPHRVEQDLAQYAVA